MKLLLIVLIALVALAAWSIGAHASPADQTKQIDRLMSTLYRRGQFNGVILVARQGKILYRNAFGKANFQTGAKLTPETPFCVGSVTKQFTAMAIMSLVEQHKLDYDDPVSKYIPEFARAQHTGKITVRQLLTHTSGIPDFGDLVVDDSDLDNDKLIRVIMQQKTFLFKPGQKYQYSNPGYGLLAIVVERISGQTYSDFLDAQIFKPLGMGKTFVYDRPQKRDKQAAVGYDQFGQQDDVKASSTPGYGAIYSTVDDLFKWDQALYTEKLVRQSTLSMAFTPGAVEQGRSTYGFGWNVAENGGDKAVWHTGNSAGFRAFIERRLGERTTVIMLTNRGNSKRVDINAAIENILADKPYTLPQRSGAEELYKTIHRSGIQAATQLFHSVQKTQSTDFDMSESEMNTLGYQLLYGDHRISDAVTVFELNTTEHPASSNAFDSLGEAYRQAGDKALAIKSYEKAVSLDPTNLHAVAMLRELK